MKTTLKRVALVAGLLGAGSLLAYGPGFGGLGFPGHHGWGGHVLSMGYGPVAFLDGDVDARLDTIKTELAITPDQEAAWNGFAESLKAHATSARAAHESTWPYGGPVTVQERSQLRERLWQQRQSVHQAASKLVNVLDDQQRVKAESLISYGMHHSF